MMSEFIHMQTKSHYSIVSGLPKTNQIIDIAVECGMKAVALTDKNTFFGLVKFYNYAINEGIKPICGVDFDLRNKFGRSHILLYAKSKKGLEALFNLSTKAFLNSDRDGYFIEEKDIFDSAQDLLCILPSNNAEMINIAGGDTRDRAILPLKF